MEHTHTGRFCWRRPSRAGPSARWGLCRRHLGPGRAFGGDCQGTDRRRSPALYRRDSQALEEGRAALAPWAGQITFLHGNFGDLAALLDGAGVERVDGMLFDLGVSSPQLDDPARGFSYQADAPLDMRMDQGETLTAWTVVNQWPRQELRRVLAQYGEERYAGRHCRRHRAGPGGRSH